MHYVTSMVNIFGTSFGPIATLFVLWNLFWKGLALWHAARKNQEWWFIILLVVNTVGILEIIYLFAVLGLKPSKLFFKGAESHAVKS